MKSGSSAFSPLNRPIRSVPGEGRARQCLFSTGELVVHAVVLSGRCRSGCQSAGSFATHAAQNTSVFKVLRFWDRRIAARLQTRRCSLLACAGQSLRNHQHARAVCGDQFGARFQLVRSGGCQMPQRQARKERNNQDDFTAVPARRRLAAFGSAGGPMCCSGFIAGSPRGILRLLFRHRGWPCALSVGLEFQGRSMYWASV